MKTGRTKSRLEYFHESWPFEPVHNFVRYSGNDTSHPGTLPPLLIVKYLAREKNHTTLLKEHWVQLLMVFTILRHIIFT